MMENGERKAHKVKVQKNEIGKRKTPDLKVAVAEEIAKHHDTSSTLEHAIK